MKANPIQILVAAFIIAAVVGIATGQWAWALVSLALASLVSLATRATAALERIASTLEQRAE
jgi:membrane protein implicated in regulation of membrane protease activity